METKNAIITSAEIMDPERGFLDAWIMLDYGDSGQGFGGWALYLPKAYSHHKLLSPAGHFIWRVMQVAGVSQWSTLPGKTVRARCDLGKVYSIGHIVKDDWFTPGEDFEKMKEGL